MKWMNKQFLGVLLVFGIIFLLSITYVFAAHTSYLTLTPSNISSPENTSINFTIQNLGSSADKISKFNITSINASNVTFIDILEKKADVLCSILSNSSLLSCNLTQNLTNGSSTWVFVNVSIVAEGNFSFQLETFDNSSGMNSSMEYFFVGETNEEISPNVNFLVSKTSTLSTYNVSNIVPFVINITNLETSQNITYLVISDSFNESFLVFNSSSVANTSGEAGIVVWDDVTEGVHIAPGESFYLFVNMTAISQGNNVNNSVEANATRADGNNTIKNSSKLINIGPEPFFDFSVSKAAINVPASYSPTDTVEFLINITNNGTLNIEKINVTDIFNASCLGFLSSSIVKTSNGTGRISWVNISGTPLAPDASILLYVNFTAIAACNTSNYAYVNATSGSSLLSRNWDYGVIIDTGASVSIHKETVNPPSSYSPGDTVQFRINITNNGQANLNEINLSDTFNASCIQYAWSNISPTSNGTGSINWTNITESLPLAPGSVFSVTVNFTALAQCNTTNYAAVSATDGTVEVNDSGGYNFEIGSGISIDLSINNTGILQVGETAQFIVNITNDGIVNLSSVNLTILFDDSYLSFLESEISPDQEGAGELNWTNPVSINFSAGNSSSFAINFSVLKGGSTYLNGTVTATDGSEGASQNHFMSFFISYASPTVILQSPADNAKTSSPSVNFRCLAYHDVNISNVSLFGNWSGEWALNDTDYSGDNNTIYNFSKTLPDGLYKWNCQACDNTSNCAWGENRTILIDSLAPVITYVLPQNNSNHSATNITINYTITDINFDSGTWFFNSSFYGIISYESGSITLNNTLAESYSHNFIINATDIAGNDATAVLVFGIDRTNPLVSFTSPENYYNSSEINLTFNYSIIEPSFLNASWVYNATSNGTISSNGTGSFSLESASEGINQNVTITAIDTAGNTGTATIFFSIDRTSPVVVITYPANNSNTTDYNLTFYYTITESNFLSAGWVYNSTVNGSIGSSGSGNFTVNNTVESLGQNVTVFATDIAGNVGSFVLFFGADRSAPVFSSISLSDSVVQNNTNVTVVVNVSDSGVGVYSVVANGVALADQGGNIWSGTINLNDTASNVTVVASDFASNNATNDSTSFVIYFNVSDTTAPEITSITAYNTSSGTTSGTAAIVALTDDYSACWIKTSSFNASNHTGATLMNGAIGKTHSYYVSYSSSTTLGPYYISCQDAQGNNMSSANSTGSISVSVTSGSSSSSSSGSSSGGGMAPSAGNKTKQNQTSGQGQDDEKQEKPGVKHKKFNIPPGKGLLNNERLRAAIERALMAGNMNQNAINNMISLSEAISGKFDAERSFKFENGKSEITLKLKNTNSKKINGFVVYDIVPKSFAQSTDEIKVTTTGRIEIVNPDPEYVFYFNEILSGSEISIVYEVLGEISSSVVDEFSTELYATGIEETSQPSQSGEDEQEKAAKEKSFELLLFALLVLAVAIAVIAFIFIKKGRKKDLYGGGGESIFGDYHSKGHGHVKMHNEKEK